MHNYGIVTVTFCSQKKKVADKKPMTLFYQILHMKKDNHSLTETRYDK
jgi:hypothetical protein